MYMYVLWRKSFFFQIAMDVHVYTHVLYICMVEYVGMGTYPLKRDSETMFVTVNGVQCQCACGFVQVMICLGGGGGGEGMPYSGKIW